MHPLEAVCTPVLSSALKPVHHNFWCNSDPHRELAYTVDPVGNVRYPGDQFERTEGLLRRMREHPPVLTVQSRARKTQTKEFSESAPKPQGVSTRELDSSYAAYTAGDLSFDAMWSILFCFMERKALVEQNDFKLRKRGVSDDVVQQFVLSIRQSIVLKSFCANKGSTFHNYVERAWFKFKCTAFDRQKAEDAKLVSATEPDDFTDSDGSVEEGVSLFDTAVLANWNQRRDDVRQTLQILINACGEGLPSLERAILEDMAAGVEQKTTAARTGKSANQVRLIQRKLIERLKAGLVEVHKPSYPVQ